MPRNYTTNDLETSLRKAFVKNRFESILIDGWKARSEFKVDAISYGLSKGWLRKDRDIEESQYTAMTYKLTSKGRKYFGLSEKKQK